MRGSIVLILLAAVAVGGGSAGYYFAAAGSDTNGDRKTGQRAINWADEEILSQLTELRKDMASLREEVTALREEGQEAPGQPARRAPRLSSMELPDGPSLGNTEATVAVVEYTDFQCPYCARHHRDVFPRLKENFLEQGKVRYLVQDFPLSFHSQAEEAAVAARCAGKQGEYWAMHHKLFENGRSLGNELYRQFASELSLDEQAFAGCLTDKAMKSEVMASMAKGQELGVSGTPRFFLGRIENGSLTDIRAISGAQSYSVFEHHINELLKADD